MVLFFLNILASWPLVSFLARWRPKYSTIFISIPISIVISYFATVAFIRFAPPHDEALFEYRDLTETIKDIIRNALFIPFILYWRIRKVRKFNLYVYGCADLADLNLPDEGDGVLPSNNPNGYQDVSKPSKNSYQNCDAASVAVEFRDDLADLIGNIEKMDGRWKEKLSIILSQNPRSKVSDIIEKIENDLGEAYPYSEREVIMAYEIIPPSDTVTRSEFRTVFYLLRGSVDPRIISERILKKKYPDGL